MSKRLIWIVSLFLCLTGSAFASCGGSSCQTGLCGSANAISDCQCTDPFCSSSDSCISRESCCHVFGNIGTNDPVPGLQQWQDDE